MDVQQLSYCPNQSNTIQYRKAEARADTLHQLCSYQQTRSILGSRGLDKLFDDEDQLIMLSEFGSVYVALIIDEIEKILRDYATIAPFQLSDANIVYLAVMRVKMTYSEFGK